MFPTENRNFYHAHMAGPHTAVPQLSMRGNNIYVHAANRQITGNRAQPWYQVRGNKIYNTIYNPAGRSYRPQYEIRGNKVFTTRYHPVGISHLPAYKIR